MARSRRECGYATKITRRDASGEVKATTYLACTLPDDPPHERHEARDRSGKVQWWLRGVDFDVRDQR